MSFYLQAFAHRQLYVASLTQQGKGSARVAGNNVSMRCHNILQDQHPAHLGGALLADCVAEGDERKRKRKS